MPNITIRDELYKKIKGRADDEGVAVSKLTEKLLLEATTKKTIDSCPRCAFKF